MKYTIQKLAKLAGVTSRTLRYYDQIGLLCPDRDEGNQYRFYTQAQVDRLQLILFYRALGLPLEQIRQILTAPDFQRLNALKAHKDALLAEQERITLLIDTVNKTILQEEGKIMMTDKEKFQGLKQRRLEENEARYGKELGEKYDKKTLEQSRRQFAALSEQDYGQMQALEQELKQALELAVLKGVEAGGPEGARLAQLHKSWLSYTWAAYSPQAHRGLGDLYIQDSRFTAYYDETVPGCAAFLREAIHTHIKD